MLTYKRKLILTKAQECRIENWIGVCRLVYNMALEIRIAAWRNKQQRVHKYELLKQLTQIRTIDWVGDLPRGSLDLTIFRLERAYQQFFSGGGFPKFANKRKYRSIEFCVTIQASDDKIQIPKIGILKIFKESLIEGKVKRIIIKKEPTGYFACIVTDAKKSIQCQDENQVLGIDMGITHFTVDSNGRFISNPRHFKRYEKKLRIENRSLARKKKYGKNWIKQAKRLSLLHHTIGNVRKDFLHKLSTQIAKENHTVFIEDLNVKGMSRSNLSKSILDAGWATFRAMLEYKTMVIAIDSKFTSQACSSCGSIDSGNRISQSEFDCKACGHKANADHNAALNILSRGTTHARKRNVIA